jgi:squalene synthase HpnC
VAIPSANARDLRDKRRTENFPVALRVLPRHLRTHLVAVYDVARVIDDLGDEATGDRLALLDEFARDLATIWTDGTPKAPVLRQLAETVRACNLPRAPFDDLIEANRMDQRVTRYRTFEELNEYCALSANPVGRIVLAVFAARSRVAPDSGTLARSDSVCTALQLIEHCQDVAEDRRAGRVYLPAGDLAAFGVSDADLDGPHTSEAVRRLLKFQTDRAADLLSAGVPLVGGLRGWARLAVAGFVAGGQAAVDSLRRARWEVLAGPPRVRRRDVARHGLRLLARSGRRGEQP